MSKLSVRALEQKAAYRRMADECGIAHKAIADMLGVAYSTFQAYLDPSIDIHLPSHRQPAFLAICRKSRAAVEYWASLQNAVVVALPAAGESDRCKLADVHAEMGVWLRQHGAAIADGRITPAESAEYAGIAARLQSCIAAQVLFFERCASSSSSVLPMRRGGAA